MDYSIASNKNHNYRKLIDDITDIVKSADLTDAGKLKTITVLLELQKHKKVEEDQAKAALFEQSLVRVINDSDYFDTLEKLSIKLQNRVSCILEILKLNENNSVKNANSRN